MVGVGGGGGCGAGRGLGCGGAGGGATPGHRFAGPWLALYLLTNLSLIIVTHAVGLPSIRVGASFISYHCARSVALAFRCRPSVS